GCCNDENGADTTYAALNFLGERVQKRCYQELKIQKQKNLVSTPTPKETGQKRNRQLNNAALSHSKQKDAESVMARPIISPVSINPTAPETFVILNQRMRVVEEQTSALLRELQTLGVNGHSMDPFPSKTSENLEDHQSITPIRARVAFIGGHDTLWRTCDTLVNRMCRLESVMQTLKLNMYRLQTEKELNPKHAANLEQRLNTIQEEHMEELKVLQMEGRMLCQQLRESREEEEKARAQAKRLTAALEIATVTKRDAAIAADELRVVKKKLNHELQELTEQLSKESSVRKSLEESQAVLLYRMQDMEVTVEKERQQLCAVATLIRKDEKHGIGPDLKYKALHLQIV
ncbi:hypothetical protein EYD10_10029, partial [Varanus komodoensis]